VLSTSRNIDDLRALIEGLSLVYLNVIGERIDIVNTSLLMFSWTESETYNDDLFKLLVKICLEKESNGLFFEQGCSTELVNIIKSIQQM